MTTSHSIGPYQIISELGLGGMAVVYRALDTRVNHEVALKVLLPQYADDETFLQRFIREGQNTKRLRHPAIARTFDAGEIDGNYYIAMEVVEGSNLSEYVKDQGSLLPFSETIDILSQIAGALDYAHTLGFLHRDIKLTNILIGNDGRALLSDFGAAKQISADYTMLTATGQSIGTPSYMSPEQARAEINLDFRTDVYSLGVVAYKLFTGRMPYTADNQPELLYKIVYDEVPDPQQFNAEIPEAVANVLRRVLSKQAGRRYESAGTFVGAIVASKRWKLNVAEDLNLARTTEIIGLKEKTSSWRGIYLAAGSLACVVILLALSSTVRPQDKIVFDMSQIVGNATDSINGSINDLDLSELELSELDLSSIDLSGIDLSSIDIGKLPINENGQIDIRNLNLSAEQLTILFEGILDGEKLDELRRSALNVIPGNQNRKSAEQVDDQTSNSIKMGKMQSIDSQKKNSGNSTGGLPPLPIIPKVARPYN